MTEDREDLNKALHLLEQSIHQETVGFERRVYGKPFLPKNEEESARVFGHHCQGLNEYFGAQKLQHFCWMGVPQGTEQSTSFFLQFKNGEATHRFDQVNIQLIPERIGPVIDGFLYDLKLFGGTPQRVPGPKCIACYIVLENEGIVQLAKQPVPGKWPNSFMYCHTFFVAQNQKQQVIEALRAYVGGKRIHFEAYHAIAGFEQSSFEEISKSEIVGRAVALATMQFQRQWGSREQEMRLDRERREAQLRQASDLLSTFDEVLHSGLNVLRSINSLTACQDFAKGTPPASLRYRLVKRVSGQQPDAALPDERMELRLLKTLRRIWQGEEATAAALSLGRLLAHRKILNSMRSKEEVTLDVLVERALDLFEGYEEGQQPRKPYTHDFSRPALSRGRIPVGYLGQGLLSVLIYELLLNAYKHSRQPIEIRLRAEGSADSVCLFVSSRVQEGKRYVERDGIALPEGSLAVSARKSFLVRFHQIEEILEGGLSIHTRVVVHEDLAWYEAEVCMRSLKTEDQMTVQPRWEQIE